MKCISKKLVIAVILILSFSTTGCIKGTSVVTKYEKETYYSELYKEACFSTDLCVVNDNISLESFQYNSGFYSTALMDIQNKQVWLSSNVHKQVFPASLTKIMTIYLALKYGTLTDSVTVSKNATSVPSDSSVAGLLEGDTLSLKDLLYGTMLPSGNDAAVAVAEHISGSVEKFVSLMNKEARALGATNTNFVNPHGYHDEQHYTTAYDLYLILNQAILNETFCEIIHEDSYRTVVYGQNGARRDITWLQSNKYINGQRTVPENVTVIGGKTGTTGKAGACLILYVEDENKQDYIAILMGADSRTYLYDCMTFLLSSIPNL